MGGRGIKSLKARVGQKCSISRGGATLNSGGIQAQGVRERSHSVVSRRSRDAARGGGGEAPAVRAAKSFEFRGE